MKTYISNSEKETKEIAIEFSKSLKGGEIICFNGGLGAGKTAFTQGICKGLKFDGYVNSPSYIILNIYNTEKFNIYHYDLYRISSVYELTEIGFYEFAGAGSNITIIEWSEMLEDEIDNLKSVISIDIDVISANSREIRIG